MNRCLNIDDVNKIVENYVSNEVFNLMKENDFIGWLQCRYHNNGDLKTKMLTFERPSIGVAMAWIRRKYNIAIEPYVSASGWDCTFSKISTGSHITSLYDENDVKSDQEMTKFFSTYENACDAAIKFTLEKLIKNIE